VLLRLVLGFALVRVEDRRRRPRPRDKIFLETEKKEGMRKKGCFGM